MNPTQKFLVAIVSLAVLGGIGYGLYSLGMDRGMKMAAPGAASSKTSNGGLKAGDVDPATGKRVLYWHDPMVPGQRFDKPGKSPFMDMQLVPVYAEGGGGDEAGVSISTRLQQNLGIRTAEATRAKLAHSVEAVGSIAYNERDVAVVQARANGFLEKLYVRAPLDPVRKGQPLAELYVPDWVAEQEEYLSARRIASQTQVSGLGALVEGARQRMRLAGMTEEQIRLVETTGKVQPRVTIVAPIGGVVGELAAREGMTVAAGAPLFRLNGLGAVWVNVDVPEAHAAAIRPGAPASATVAAYPGEKFSGRVEAVLPEFNVQTRTLRVRVEVSNPGARLKPGMFATVNLTPTQARETVVIPSEAVIVTGTRKVVIVDRGEGRFEPVDVEIGREDGGRTEILKGIEAGTRVVASGQFLLDSEASLRGFERRLVAPAQAGAQSHKAEGRLEKIGKGELTISHGPVPSLKWPPMTMDFAAPKGGLPQGVKAGDPIAFDFVQTPSGEYEVTKIEKRGGGKP